MTTNETTKTAESSQTIDFSIWKTIKIGTGFSPQEMIRMIKNTQTGKFGRAYPNWMVSEKAKKIMNLPEFILEQESEIDLVLVSSEILGVRTDLCGTVKYQDVLKRATSMGLLICPAEVGPQLRIQYYESNTGQIFIGMKPLEIDDNLDACMPGSPTPHVFVVGHTDISWASGPQNEYFLSTVRCTSRFCESCRFVFIKPRK